MADVDVQREANKRLLGQAHKVATLFSYIDQIEESRYGMEVRLQVLSKSPANASGVVAQQLGVLRQQLAEQANVLEVAYKELSETMSKQVL